MKTKSNPIMKELAELKAEYIHKVECIFKCGGTEEDAKAAYIEYKMNAHKLLGIR